MTRSDNALYTVPTITQPTPPTIEQLQEYTGYHQEHTMDDLTLQSELEALAGNAWNPSPTPDHPSEPMSTTIQRWSTLFNLSPSDAVDRIVSHRNNLTRPRIPPDHWATIRTQKEAQGYDREAYEYELELQKRKANLPSLVPSADDEASRGITYLVELSGPLGTVEAVQRAAGMAERPEKVSGSSVEEGREVELCVVSSEGKNAVLHWASGDGGGFEPTILANPRSLG